MHRAAPPAPPTGPVPAPATAPTWRRARFLAPLVVAAGVLAACAPPPPAAVVDQVVDAAPDAAAAVLVANDVQPGFPGYTFAGQTFTAGATGELTQVSLQLRPQGSPLPLQVQVTTVPDGFVGCDPFTDPCPPTGTVLGGGQVAAGSESAGGWTEVTLDVAAPVEAGSRYLLLLSMDPTPVDPGTGLPDPARDGEWSVLASLADPYAGGVLGRTDVQASGLVEWIGWAGHDLLFRTWVRPAA